MHIKAERIDERFIFFETSGFSMWPFIKQGGRLITERVSIEDLKVGDIILYRRDKQLVCHRLVKRVRTQDGYLLYTRGDNTRSLVELIPEQMFCGKQ